MAPVGRAAYSEVLIAIGQPSKRSFTMDHHLTFSSSTAPQAEPSTCTLLFKPLFERARGFAFSCDLQGHVDLDAMSERARNNYFYARAMIGRELAYPSVQTQSIGV
jgi:hypothetical protein